MEVCGGRHMYVAYHNPSQFWEDSFVFKLGRFASTSMEGKGTLTFHSPNPAALTSDTSLPKPVGLFTHQQ